MITIATPMAQGVAEAGYIESLVATFKLLHHQGIKYDYITLSGDCFVDRARNRLVKRFLDSNSEELIFIDADVSFDPVGFLRLMSHDVDVIGGVYRKKVERCEYPCTVKPQVSQDNILGALMLPTGFLRIKRSVFEAIDVDNYSVFGEEIPEYFTCGKRDGRFKGEDVNFSKLLIDNGFDLWIEPNISFDHIGKKPYSGNFLDDCCVITE